LEYLDPHHHLPILQFTKSLSKPGSRMALQVLDESLREYFQTTLGLQQPMPWKEVPGLDVFIDLAVRPSGWEVERVVRPTDWNDCYERDLSHIPGFYIVFLKLLPP